MPYSGIYQIVNVVNNKSYIGSSTRDINRRFYKHKKLLSEGIHHSPYFQNAWNKYGASNFELRILALCEPSKCRDEEQKYLDSFKPEYNVCQKAHNTLGRKGSEKQRQAMKIVHLNNAYCLGRRMPHDERIRRRTSVIFSKAVKAISVTNPTETLIFNSFYDAHERGFNKNEVKRHIQGRRKTYRGYVWSLGELPSHP